MSQSYRRHLMTGSLLASAFVLAQPAYAQAARDQNRPAENLQVAPAEAAPDSQFEPGSEIVVTGTLIRNPNIEASAPVTSIGRAEVELQQVNVAEELLREIPGVVPSIGSQVNNGNGGASFVNLRGLGTNRNLVLVDGRRIVPANIGGAVDLNNIPLALLERTDVLTGGASTTYGADAVAGVVNFVTRRNFAGIDLGLSQQITERGDGNIFRGDLTVGANFDDGRGNAVLSVGYQNANPVFQGARDFSRFNVDSVSGNAGGSGTSVPTRVFIPGTGTRVLDNGVFRPATPADAFNFNPFNIFQTPFERFNIYGAANYEVTPGIEVYARGLFSKNTVSTIIAPSGAFGSQLTFGVNNPFLSDAAANTLCLASGATQAACTAARTAAPGSAADIRLTNIVQRRFVEGGGRVSEYTTTLFDTVIGVRGDITDNIGFDLFGSYGESENTQRQRNNGLLSRLRQSVDAVRLPNGQIACRNTANGCVPLNIFGGPGSITPEAFNFINASASGSNIASLATVRGVISGDIGFTSPWATEAFGFAIGGEYRDYSAGRSSDIAQQTPGEVLGNGAASPDVLGGYDVKEAFVEVIAPLIVDRPLFHSLQLELGARVSDYSTTGTSWTYKIGGSWEPVPSIKFRGGYNRATRSPNVAELFDPLRTGLDNSAIDPCQLALPTLNANLRAVCLAQGAPASTIGNIQPPSAGQINITFGGNPNLDVERADTYTAGVVLQPVFIPGLTISADYYNIKVTDAITSPTVGDVFFRCFGTSSFSATTPVDPGAGAATNPACTAIRRNPVTGGIDGDVSTTPGLPLPLTNQGIIRSSGVDLIANYQRDLGWAGLALSFAGNWTDKSQFQPTPLSENLECVGQYGLDCASPLPEFSFSQRTTLTFDRVSLSLLWRFIDDLRVQDDAAGDFQPRFERIDEKHYFDLSARYEITDRANIIFSVFNLFDKDPPIVGSTIGATAFNSGNTYPSTYDPLGRRYAVGVNLQF
ncbi:TonB-dependent receptor [Erythrobacteraceae bacterium CFH 75059]|uniref:TonB-dependent receptor domain-containing protein n=1 Tax=Qipengyuania thermophila TaxID=2509361 RepID=UPI001021D56B|nr:TonB-dependent receptor [Qipengyuania thermophila]TCD06227.1 TonB-dependent receptor [Erythrobacteraceae bacterium CFH 75059]